MSRTVITSRGISKAYHLGVREQHHDLRETIMSALRTPLKRLRKFNEELRTALGVPTFYNEALGSVSQVSVYDRVKGREGDVPDKTVGAHSPGSGH